MTTAVDLAIRSSLILCAGLGIAACLRHRSAALRHWVLAAAVFATPLVAPFSLTLPSWTISLPTSSRATDPIAASPMPLPLPAPRSVTPEAPRATQLPLVAALIWFAGFLASGSALLIGVMRLKRIAVRAPRVSDAGWNVIRNEVATAFGLTRQVVILQTDAPDLLATWGILRPRVLLPSHATEWSEERIRVVLCHELAHIRRHDWFVQITAETLRTILWFNPLMWIACTRLRRESEQACDDEVLGKGMKPREYAAQLLDLARKCRRPTSTWASATPMAHPSTLERRISAMLNPKLNRRPLSRRSIAATAALLLAVTLPIAAFRAGQGAPASLSGSVYDATGAVLPGVALTLEDAAQAKWPATTDSVGRFEFPRVPAGSYVLTASIPGFRPLRHEFDLQNARDWDRAVTLQVGDVQETITVRESRMAATAQTSPRPQFAQPVRVGGNIRAPRKELNVPPVYPVAMRAAGREGVVPIEAIIGRDGTVSSVRVLSAQVHPDFAIAAVDAVRQWRFSPTLLNGAPVEVVMTVSVKFNLAD